MFNENSETAIEIMDSLGIFIVMIQIKYDINLKDPFYDVARRFLNEIVEFKPMEKEKRSSLRPWETE